MQEEEMLISGAKCMQNTSDIYPDIEEEFSFYNFEKFILNPEQNFKEVLKIIKDGELNDLQIRFSVWRFIQKVLPVTNDVEEQKRILKEQRQEYQKNLENFKSSKQPQQAKETKPKAKQPFNPLAPPPKKTNSGSPWTGFFEDNSLKTDIKKDVERTYQDREFFNNLKIKNLLSNVLFVWSKLNPDISYRQGMNEVAASCIVIYFQEALEVQKPKDIDISQELYDTANYFINLEYAEADIYHLFNKIMEHGQAAMFVHKEDPKVKSKQNTPILQRLAKIQDYFLKVVDIELFRHLKLLEVQFTTFLVKWIRCIFTREFPMHATFTIWDNIFMDAYLFPNQQFENLTNLNRENFEINNYFLIDCIAVGMLCRIREEVLPTDEGSDCMKAYLNYPPVENIKEIIDLGFEIKHSIQAYNPQDSSTTKGKQFVVFNAKTRKDSFKKSQKPEKKDKSNPLVAMKSTPQEKPLKDFKKQQQQSDFNSQSESSSSSKPFVVKQDRVIIEKEDHNRYNRNSNNTQNDPNRRVLTFNHSPRQQQKDNINRLNTPCQIHNDKQKSKSSNDLDRKPNNEENNHTNILKKDKKLDNNPNFFKQDSPKVNNDEITFSKQEAEYSQLAIVQALQYLQGNTSDHNTDLVAKLLEVKELYLQKLGSEPQIHQEIRQNNLDHEQRESYANQDENRQNFDEQQEGQQLGGFEDQQEMNYGTELK